jgi:sigma-B regulation protein RsbU (phosphoserine phosphatase)
MHPLLLRSALAALAIVFAAATILYAALWMIAGRWTPEVELGFNNTPSLVVTDVFPHSPAEAAGLRPGDQLLAIASVPVKDEFTLYREYRKNQPGDVITLAVHRPGRAEPVTLAASFRRRTSVPQPNDWPQYFAGELRNLYPIPFVVVGLAVLFLRLGNPHVWLLALMFASLIAAPGIPTGVANVPAGLRPFAAAYQGFFLGLLGADFYAFFALFPIRSPIDRIAPWLKWAGGALGVFFGVAAMRDGALKLPSTLAQFLGQAGAQHVPFYYEFPFIHLGLISLALNYFLTRDLEARRKMRVLFWGTLIAFGPGSVRAAAIGFAGFQSPWWLDTLFTAVFWIFPLSFAYAVVKHRVLDIPVLLRRSARYVLVQRGFVVVLSLISIAITFLFASLFDRYVQPLFGADEPAGIGLGAILGTLLLAGGLRVHRMVSARIDRAFFRSAYDARLILGELAERTRTATDRAELAQLLEQQIERALHPRSLGVYLRSANGDLTSVSGEASVRADAPLLVELARTGEARELPSNGSIPAGLNAECLVPVLSRRQGLLGVLALGPRLSDEPYSAEDKRLLTAVAGQAGTALENLSLAEEIAERIESERRATHEMEIAKAVQARLLPQSAPAFKTLECAARCLQTRSVGGDYYDFLRLGPDRVGLVLADVAGKGFHAALLMSTLQAHLRSQVSTSPLDPVHALQRVNRMLWECTDPQHYATLFLGLYNDLSRELVYVNCGHLAPILLHPDGTLERFESTATVLGLFEQWDCTAERVHIAPGDLLVVFSDGVTEAMHNDEEFGEERLIELVRARSGLPVNDIVTGIFNHVLEFSAGDQSDDLTVLVARSRCGNHDTIKRI